MKVTKEEKEKINVEAIKNEVAKNTIKITKGFLNSYKGVKAENV